MATMFQPTRNEVRQFFCEAWRKHLSHDTPSPQERIAIACMLEHPEYHHWLESPQLALTQEFTGDDGRENPFLHLSMHLALEEQLSIDQPHGVRHGFEALQQRCTSRHDAAHQAMECLGEILWRTQRGLISADMPTINDAYLECLCRRADIPSSRLTS
jgi:hypothetical protein